MGNSDENSVLNQKVTDSAFDLANDTAYLQWRSVKLRYKQPRLEDLLTYITDPYSLTAEESLSIISCCSNNNVAIYQLSDAGNQNKALVHALGSQLSMGTLDTNLRADEDSVSSLEVRSQEGNQYIPYTNKALSWHTDGYYNTLDKQIFGFILHCVKPAMSGGVSQMLNPEQLYIALRDEDPAFIAALMHPEAMTIPDNVENGKVIRAAQSGPVFVIKPPVGLEAGRLHMRFSARKRNIVWRDTPETINAVAMINRLLSDENNVFTATLKAGQGIICNNVLHNRSAFTDSETQKRLMYRARYYDAVG